jgi:hypothetical protein
MSRTSLFVLSLLGFASCSKLGSTSIESESLPLVRVDGSATPVTINNATGGSTQIVSGQLTVYSSRTECQYVIALSTGISIPGSTSCVAGDITLITNGVELHLDLAAAGGPQGSHDYDFVAFQQPCTCAKSCLCQSNRLLPGARQRISTSPTLPPELSDQSAR